MTLCPATQALRKHRSTRHCRLSHFPSHSRNHHRLLNANQGKVIPGIQAEGEEISELEEAVQEGRRLRVGNGFSYRIDRSSCPNG